MTSLCSSFLSYFGNFSLQRFSVSRPLVNFYWHFHTYFYNNHNYNLSLCTTRKILHLNHIVKGKMSWKSLPVDAYIYFIWKKKKQWFRSLLFTFSFYGISMYVFAWTLHEKKKAKECCTSSVIFSFTAYSSVTLFSRNVKLSYEQVETCKPDSCKY